MSDFCQNFDIAGWIRCIRCDERKPKPHFSERGWENGPICNECLRGENNENRSL